MFVLPQKNIHVLKNVSNNCFKNPKSPLLCHLLQKKETKITANVSNTSKKLNKILFLV